MNPKTHKPVTKKANILLKRGNHLLLSGPNGIGKSTLTLQLAQWCASEKNPVLYVSGEE